MHRASAGGDLAPMIGGPAVRPEQSGIEEGDPPPRRSFLLVAVAGAAALVGFAIIALRAGSVEYDDAYYFKQGLFHAHQVEDASWKLLRLARSLTFEPQRPPLFHGWVALGALTLGDADLKALFLWSLWVPYAMLILFAAFAGRRAGGVAAAAFAVLALLAAPAVMDLAAKTMVDILLSAAVAATLCALARRLDGGRVGSNLLVGLACGAAALAKLTAVLFVGPMLLFGWYWIARREGWRDATRFALSVGGVALLVAAPWYLPQGVEAYRFAKYAASFWPCADTGSAWTRPLRLLGATLGWPLAAGVISLWLTTGASSGPRPAALPWNTLAIAASLPAAFVVMFPVVFEPRYLLPALGPVSVAVGLRAAWAYARWGNVGRVAVVTCAMGLVAVAMARAWALPRYETPWGAGPLLAELADSGGESGPPSRVCTLGNTPGWNVYKLRLVAEQLRLRPKLEVVDWLRQTPESCPKDIGAACDMVLVLDAAGVPPVESQLRLNEGLAECIQELDLAGAGYSRCRECDARLGSEAPVAVWIRDETAGELRGAGR